jgi:hypothetical protein
MIREEASPLNPGASVAELPQALRRAALKIPKVAVLFTKIPSAVRRPPAKYPIWHLASTGMAIG